MMVLQITMQKRIKSNPGSNADHCNFKLNIVNNVDTE